MKHRYDTVRARTLELAAPLSDEDCQVQSMPDASPVKWHLAHTTWFFETFVLERHEPDYKPFDAAFRVLYNSYYNAVGDKHPRAQRGLISRPGLDTVKAYRAQVDARIARLLDTRPVVPELLATIELGLQHEQQHQELMLTDLLHLLSCNPTLPVYRAPPQLPQQPPGLQSPHLTGPADWVDCPGGVVEIGHRGEGFAFDNEQPHHRVLLEPYALAQRLVTQGEWLAFIDDGGYRDPRWWLSAGWDWVLAQRIEAPLYWRRSSGGWQVFGLHGSAAVQPSAPVVHISCYEADAYARWRAATDADAAGARLPTEAEWEAAAAPQEAAAIAAGRFADAGLFTPQAAAGHALTQLFGEVWQWTASPYVAYPGFRPWTGAVGEYNGKFMINQQVLRGGSVATPRAHIRASYRNFFPADARWQFTGLRLARDHR